MDLDKLIKKGDWVFAKTYTDFAPHQYLTRDDNQELCRKMDKDDFLEKMIGEKKKYSKAKIILKT